MVTDLHVYTNNSQVTFKCNKKGYKITGKGIHLNKKQSHVFGISAQLFREKGAILFASALTWHYTLVKISYHTPFSQNY